MWSHIQGDMEWKPEMLAAPTVLRVCASGTLLFTNERHSLNAAAKLNAVLFYWGCMSATCNAGEIHGRSNFLGWMRTQDPTGHTPSHGRVFTRNAITFRLTVDCDEQSWMSGRPTSWTSVIKLLLLQEGTEAWGHEFFMQSGTKSEHRQLFPDLFRNPPDFFKYFRINYGN
jgi:hypothetical protein